MIINNIKKIALVVMAAAPFFAGCAKDDTTREGKGEVALNVKSLTPTLVVKSDAQPVYKIEITDSNDKLIKQYENHNEIDKELWLLAGDYNIKAEAGTLVEAAFDSPCYLTKQTFSVKANELNQVNVGVGLVNSKVSVEYATSIKDNFTAYSTIVTNEAKALQFSGTETKSGYFKLNNGVLKWTIELTSKSGQNASFEGDITGVKANDHYIIKFDLENSPETGGLRVIAIVTNENTDAAIDNNLDVNVKRYPEIVGSEFDIKEELNLSGGDPTAKIVVDLKGYPTLKSAVVTFKCDYLSALLGGLNTINLMDVAASDGLMNDLDEVFVNVSKLPQTELNSNGIRFDITRLLFSTLPNTGENDEPYSFTFTVVDQNNVKIEKTLLLNKVDSDVTTTYPTENNIWGNRIVDIKGTWIGDTQPTSLGFEYRVDKGEWEFAPASNIDPVTKSFTATITGLTPDTKYSVRAKSELNGNIVNVVTDFPTPLYNGGFNDWTKEADKVWYARDNSTHKFWDTGNVAASTMGQNPTTPDYDNKVEGTASAKLLTQYVVIKLAAGNIFAGEFIGLIGMDTPNMNFGEPFTSRPTSLKGSYQYISQVINKSSSNANYKKMIGLNDRYQIYIMLTTADNMPVNIDAKEKSPFDIDKIAATGTDGNITAIAYGGMSSEYIVNGEDKTPAVNMSGFEEFTIPLKYFNTTQKPAYIVIVASASKYGDFYTGGENSTLWLDDFKLTYE